ncbi:cytochrome P450 [Aspergillus carlsbadensis]|nr:cytochrome P450 [Aspergillus carlsbadensis]
MGTNSPCVQSQDPEVKYLSGPLSRRGVDCGLGLPIVGNIFDIDLDNGTMSTLELAKAYYPIFKFTFAGETSILVNSVELLSELCDETRFHKHISSGLDRIRAGTNDGLFTAHDDERNWEVAHRLLVPAFGPLRIREMLPQMHDIAQQLCLKWYRYGPRKAFNLADDFTRATLDTIALCAMDFRFNSFYSDGDFHPFIQSMARFLKEAETQATLPSIVNSLRLGAKRQDKLDIKLMRNVCQDIVNERRSSTTGRKSDLLDTMLNSRDPVSGEGLSDESIIDNMVTFLIAGHETTSGLLSFVMYYLLKAPEAMAKATKEIDGVVGNAEVTAGHLSKLKYLNAVLRETLRLMPTAPGFTVTPYKPEVIGGKYEFNPGDSLDVFLAAVHRDPAVYGSDADEFRPERMLDEYFQRLPPNAWKPFGNGKRSCIGRAFAWQEALLILAMILQTFTFELVDKDYQLKLKESLTIKPDNLWVHATPRPGRTPVGTWMSTHAPDPNQGARAGIGGESGGFQPATILYGSNSGTCETLAQRLAVEMNSKGNFRCLVQAMDDFEGQKPPKGQPLIIITGSYDGTPPDNARRFVAWLQALEGDELEGVCYAVFGCGHRDWASTFHKVPTLLDDLMSKHGGTRITPRRAIDTAQEDPFAEMEDWIEQSLWPGVEASFNIGQNSSSGEAGNSTGISLRAPYALRAGFEEALVREIRVLTSSDTSKKVHIELALPGTINYQPGDHLAILPFNPPQMVQRVLCLFHLGPDNIIYITSRTAGGLPTDTPISTHDLLSGYTELNQVATPSSIRAIAARSTDRQITEDLEDLATHRYVPDVREKRRSLLDILESHPVSAIGIREYLQMLPPLRPRQYTISSSPGQDRGRASLTVSVRDGTADAESGRRTVAVASNYLMNCLPGSLVRVSLRQGRPAFRLPAEGSADPIIMVAAGSGIAPFRAFIQELSDRKGGETASPEPPALLFFGCRGLHLDDLYREELDGYEAKGVVAVLRAFSQMQSPRNGCRYVQDMLWNARERVRGLWDQGAKIFVCGSMEMNQGVKAMILRIVPSTSTEDFAGRYVAEVFT